MGTAYLSHCFVNVKDAPPSRIDKNEQDMWWPQAGINAAAASHSPKQKAGTIGCDQAVKGIEKIALRVNANILHKDQLATFVSWHSIHFAAHLAGANARLCLSCGNLFKDGSETAELNRSLCEQSSGWVAHQFMKIQA